MTTWTKYGLGLALAAGLSPASLQAQVAAPAAVAPVAAVAPAPRTIWAFLGLTKEQKEDLKRKCCKTPFGQLLNNALKPVSIFTGGILGNFCPQVPSPEDLLKPGPEGVAAKIQAEEANAAARRAAVRYLGTVDCHYWGPEAEPALIAALRTDRNECVRLEAAMALSRGCCCTKKTIEALAITVSGSDKDGNPSEKSERVKAAASVALTHCLACYSETTPVAAEQAPPPKPIETPPAKPLEPGVGNVGKAAPPTEVQRAVHAQKLEAASTQQVVENARRVMTERGNTMVGQAPGHSTHGRSLFEIVRTAASTRRLTPTPTTASEPMLADEPKAEPKAEAPVVQRISAQVAAPAPTPKPTPSAVVPATPMLPPVPKTEAAPLPKAPADRSAASGPAKEHLNLLRSSIYPEQREWAADQLACVDTQAEPEVVPALVTAAREDAAPIVRAACIRALTKLNASSPAVVAALQALRSDADPRVRVAAQKALAKLAAGQSTAAR